MSDALSTPVSLKIKSFHHMKFEPSPLARHSLRKQITSSFPQDDCKGKVKNGNALDRNTSNSEGTPNRCKDASQSQDTPSPVGIQGIRKRLEQQFSKSGNIVISGQEVSPGLSKIQNTPGTLKKTRQELIIKHKDIQSRSDQLNVGGGVTLWPEMDVLRLSVPDVLRLFGYAGTLSIITLLIFNKIHGKTFLLLQKFREELKAGCDVHKLHVYNKSVAFDDQVISWHKFLLWKTEAIQDHFDMSVTSSQCLLYLAVYASGMTTLVYFLVENMQAKNRLTPLRIKTWTCLLCVIGSWTVSMSFGLYKAFALEQQAVNCVRQYAAVLGQLVTMSVDLNTYQSVLLYWRTCLLDSSADGLIRVLGIATVKDLVFYLQYYSIPIATVLLTPVIKLFISIWTVYGSGKHIKVS